MTFTLVARCQETGMLGVAVSSSSPAVAARCAFARAGVGAAASQNITDPSLGPLVLEALARGLSAQEAVDHVRQGADFIEYRQLLAVDRQGRTAIYSGSKALGIWAEAQSKNIASGGNLLANADVPQAIVEAFTRSSGGLGDRLIAALKAGLSAGGEAGPLRSAGMKVVDNMDWPVVDLRCDWSENCPITELEAVWSVYKPQLKDYVKRAIDPRSAPSYGVPGDE